MCQNEKNTAEFKREQTEHLSGVPLKTTPNQYLQQTKFYQLNYFF